MEEFDKRENQQEREELFSKSVKAGKRTYFFDVKSTRKNDYYLTITERKKRFDSAGKLQIEKHKIFLYKEDFEKFMDALEASINHIDEQIEVENKEKSPENKFLDIDFEDLGEK